MPVPEPANLTWVKASASSLNGCVQMAALPDGSLAIQDSKHPGQGRLRCSAEAWRALLEAARNSELDGLG